MEDRDNIRVDLLKFRRKAYLSYSENSPERKKFLKTILENELRFKEKDIPKDLVNFLIEGDRVVLQDTIKEIVLCVIGIALSWTVAVLGRPLFHGIISSIFAGAGIGCLLAAIRHGYDYFKYRKSLNVIKQYSNDMRQQMNRISNEIKRLDGPYGF